MEKMNFKNIYLKVFLIIVLGLSGSIYAELESDQHIKVWVQLGAITSCEQSIPGIFSESEYIEEWKKKNRKKIAGLLTNPEYITYIEYVENIRYTEKKLKELRDACKNFELRIIEEVNVSAERYETPEHAWQAWVKFLVAGDRNGAKSCLTSSARGKLSPLLDAMSAKELTAMGRRVNQFEVSDYIGEYFAEGIVADSNGRAGFVYFHRKGGGWLISEI